MSAIFASVSAQSVAEEEAEAVGEAQTTNGDHFVIRAHHLRAIEVHQRGILEGLQIDGEEDVLLLTSSTLMSPATEDPVHLPGAHRPYRGHHQSLLHDGGTGLDQDVSIVLAVLHRRLVEGREAGYRDTEDRIMVTIVKDPIHLPRRLAHVHLEDVLTKIVASAHLYLAVPLLPQDPLAETDAVGVDTHHHLQPRTDLTLVQ